MTEVKGQQLDRLNYHVRHAREDRRILNVFLTPRWDAERPYAVMEAKVLLIYEAGRPSNFRNE